MNTREPLSARGLQRTGTLTILGALAALTPAHPALAQRYDIFLCEPAPQYYVLEVNGINNHGSMVGTAYRFGTAGEVAVLWREDGEMVELPNLYPPRTSPNRTPELAQASDINDAGLIVGRANSLQLPDRAVMWTDERTIVALTDRESVALSVNNNGVIVGRLGGGAFMWEDGVLTNLFPPMMAAYSINNQNQIVGSGGSEAILWQDGEFTTLPGLGSRAYGGDINEIGQIVGQSNTSDPTEYVPVIWEDGVVRELPAPANLSSGVGSINGRGEMVGLWFPSPGSSRPAMRRNNLMMDLRDLTVGPNAEDWEPYDGGNGLEINESGQIAARAGNLITYEGRAARLDPVDIGLTLWGINPSRPGRRNVVQVNHATPGGRVILLWGTTRGEAQPFEPCSGALIDLTDPHFAATAIAGPDGVAQFRVNVPANVDGQTFILQVVDHATCEVSPPAWALFKMEN